MAESREAIAHEAASLSLKGIGAGLGVILGYDSGSGTSVAIGAVLGVGFGAVLVATRGRT